MQAQAASIAGESAAPPYSSKRSPQESFRAVR